MNSNFPKSYNIEHKKSTTHKIGQDMRGVVNYNFNQQGFRSNIDYQENEKNAIAFFGNLYTSAVGIDWNDGFPQKICDGLNMQCYNFSQGCAGVDNNEIVRTVRHVVQMESFKPSFYVVQLCELERRFSQKSLGLRLETDKEKNIENFLEVFAELETLMKEKQWMFFVMDHTLKHNVPSHIINHERCLCWNPYIIDKILQGIPGEKWHEMMGYSIARKIKKNAK
jgi:hypothetical protein